MRPRAAWASASRTPRSCASFRAEPAFAGVTGKFDPQRFAQIIRQMGYTEQRYHRRTAQAVAVRKQIETTIGSGVEPPKALLDALQRYRDEQRSIDYVQLGAAQAGDIGEPSPEALASYFDERKALFRAPEFRKVAVVVLTPQDQAKWADVSDDDARKVFETTKARYETAERRHVLQMRVSERRRGERRAHQADGRHVVRGPRQGARARRRPTTISAP